MDLYDKEELLNEQQDEKETKERQNRIRIQMGVMGKLHNLVVYIRGSSGRTKEFVELAGRRIPLNNRTRWNSWYTMLKVTQEQTVKEALISYTEKYLDAGTVDKRDILSPEDWNQLRIISNHLAIFEGATLHLQGDRTTLERVSESLEVIYQWLQDTLVSRTTSLYILYLFKLETEAS
jgi:hypothetical protein